MARIMVLLNRDNCHIIGVGCQGTMVWNLMEDLDLEQGRSWDPRPWMRPHMHDIVG